MADCIFCKLIEGELPSQTVYEDGNVKAFLSIQPIRPGHVLIIPRMHEPDVFNLPPEIYTDVMTAAYNLVPVLKKVYSPLRVGLMVAGLEVDHAHVHVVPIHDSHDLTSKRLLDGSAVIVDQAALEPELKKILEALNSK